MFYLWIILIKSENNYTIALETNFEVGKSESEVRDTYELPDKLILITTDRQSAFDRVRRHPVQRSSFESDERLVVRENETHCTKSCPFRPRSKCHHWQKMHCVSS